MSEAGARRAALAAALALLVFGLWRAAALAWICDDAFVSLRYAANWAAGHGLVYNPGEYVEGYTNLLWTLLLGLALRLGLPDVASAEWLGIAAYAGLALLLLRASWSRHARDGTPLLPLAAGAVLVSPDFHEWASGGLETSLFALLATAGVLASRGAPRSDRRALGAGALLSLLTLTRPDGALLAGVASLGVALCADPERRLRAAAGVALPVALTLSLWAAWKLSYYGELLPTAFYSKSVLRPYWGQGLVYLGLYLAKSWFLPATLLGVAALRLRWRRGFDARDAEALALAAPALVYWLYVVHVGGDFMFARRVLPVVPLLLLALEELLVRLPDRRLVTGLTLACVAAAALPYPVFGERARIRGVADERRFYPERVIEMRRRQADAVARVLEGTGARVMFEGGMCVFGYYSGLPYLAEMTGLTQYSLARLPLERRGWIGHEKRASEDWLTENDIHLIVGQAFPPVARPPGPGSEDLIFFGDAAVARIHRYEPQVMDVLARREGVDFVPIDRVIERRRREIQRSSPERARELLAWLEGYYFRGAGERGREEWESLRSLVASRAEANEP